MVYNPTLWPCYREQTKTIFIGMQQDQLISLACRGFQHKEVQDNWTMKNPSIDMETGHDQ